MFRGAGDYRSLARFFHKPWVGQETVLRGGCYEYIKLAISTALSSFFTPMVVSELAA